MKKKNLYIIAGCNGAGKTTASLTILRDFIDCDEFINADAIAKGLSPFQPEKVAIEAGRIMLKRIDVFLKNEQTFAFETTLSTKSYKSRILEAKGLGYTVTLLFFWLQSIELARRRVESRVLEGGHNIEPDVIERRYIRGIENLFDIYIPIVDGVMIFDNTFGKSELIASKTVEGKLTVFADLEYKQLKAYYDNRKRTI